MDTPSPLLALDCGRKETKAEGLTDEKDVEMERIKRDR